MYSGDITDAPDGAVEYLYADNGLREPTLVLNNVYAGDNNCEYKIVIGRGSNINKQYMMNPNKVFAEIKCQSVQKQTVIGLLLSEYFVLLNFSMGNLRVSGSSEISSLVTKALYQQWSNPLTLKKVLRWCGAEFKEDADIDLSLDNLEKDTFIKLFEAGSSDG